MVKKFLASIKAVVTRLVFGAHGFVAIWQVTQYKENLRYWYLSCPILLLFFEGIFTLTIKENQEWKWFCPSVFLYLGSVVPAIWLLELDKVDRRLKAREETFNLSVAANFQDLNKYLGVPIRLPEIQLSAETWVTLIEQFLMLILIVGRWMLPKGDLTRDQLSQLLLVYIGTAADIIEFFDSFKEDKVASERTLVFLTLAIWSWSLLQFTIVLSATRSRKPRGVAGQNGSGRKIVQTQQKSQGCCCSIDAWGIALNILLQDAPFLAFRLLIIIHYRIVSYMNVFFTCKNTLVILLQLYRLYVVHAEGRRKLQNGGRRRKRRDQLTDISVISGRMVKDSSRKREKYHRDDGSDDGDEGSRRNKERAGRKKHQKSDGSLRQSSSVRKDTGYSTASSQHTDEKQTQTRRPKTKPPRLSRQPPPEKPKKPPSHSRRHRTEIDIPEEDVDASSEVISLSPESDFEKYENKCGTRRNREVVYSSD
ncbi:transmembrane protein 26, partial [Ctenocephalides felis]|uniref:transmembrane protein 26 n=1 Tax=Ctenocephalides felis TaxID=7515 RepID=UPI000E6E44A0